MMQMFYVEVKEVKIEQLLERLMQFLAFVTLHCVDSPHFFASQRLLSSNFG